MGTVVDLPHKQLNMKVMGFVVLALACCLLSVSGAPAPFVDPITIGFTAATGLTLTAGTASAVIPTASLLAGKAIVIKGLLLSQLLAEQAAKKEEGGEQNRQNLFIGYEP